MLSFLSPFRKIARARRFAFSNFSTILIFNFSLLPATFSLLTQRFCSPSLILLPTTLPNTVAQNRRHDPEILSLETSQIKQLLLQEVVVKEETIFESIKQEATDDELDGSEIVVLKVIMNFRVDIHLFV